MAIFGNIDFLKQQVKDNKFDAAFDYLSKVLQKNTAENFRITSLPLGAFSKVELNESNFALEQVYNSKDRSECFFESHKKYIDVQFIVEGEEIIELENISNLEETLNYSDDMDLIKYADTDGASSLVLRKGDVAIFYPEDAHMPGLKVLDSRKVIKTVVKVIV